MKRLFPILLAVLLFGCAQPPSAPPPGLQITTQSLASTKVGEIYAEQLTAAGGVAPYVWQVISGDLPPGITLSQSGVLSGRPTVSGQYTFEIQVSDSALGENNLKSVIRIEWKAT